MTLSGETEAEAAAHAQSILNLETEIAKIQWDNVQNRNLEKMYNVYTLKDVKSLVPEFDWKTYFKATGLDKNQNRDCGAKSYFEDLNKILSSTPSMYGKPISNSI